MNNINDKINNFFNQRSQEVVNVLRNMLQELENPPQDVINTINNCITILNNDNLYNWFMDRLRSLRDKIIFIISYDSSNIHIQTIYGEIEAMINEHEEMVEEEIQQIEEEDQDYEEEDF